jgi:hypothetical protein
MSMDFQTVVLEYIALPGTGKVRCLAIIAWDLTLEFRDVLSLVIEGPSSREKIIGINEVQHRVLAQLIAHQEGRPDRYPDRDFLSLIVGMAQKYGFAGVIQISLTKSLGG